jgi:hypothetical protein
MIQSDAILMVFLQAQSLGKDMDDCKLFSIALANLSNTSFNLPKHFYFAASSYKL